MRGAEGLGSGVISFICREIEKSQTDPASPGSGQYLLGRKSRRKNSVMMEGILEPCFAFLFFWLFFFFFFFAAWTLPTQRTDSYKNCNKK